MKISAEISMYPLSPEYEQPILDFIARLKAHSSLRVEVNSLSTQLFGDYDAVMAALQQEIKKSFQQGHTISMVMKILNVSATE